MHVDTERFYTTNWQDFVHKEIITKYLAKVAYVLPRLITKNTTNFKLSDNEIEIDYITDDGKKEIKVIPLTIDVTSLSISRNNTWIINGKDSGISSLGKRGQQGSAGPSGPQGNRGAVGPKGQKGPGGKQGAQGNEGVKGVTGKAGPIGPKGQDGPTGPQGEKGNSGAVISIRDNRFYSNDIDTGLYSIGAVGPKGVTGEKGPEGEKGPDNHVKGETGPKGETGSEGHSPQYEIINNTFYVDGHSTGLPSKGEDGTFVISDSNMWDSLEHIGRSKVQSVVGGNAAMSNSWYNSPYIMQTSSNRYFYRYATKYVSKPQVYASPDIRPTHVYVYPSSSDIKRTSITVPSSTSDYNRDAWSGLLNVRQCYYTGFALCMNTILRCYYGDSEDDYFTMILTPVNGYSWSESVIYNSSAGSNYWINYQKIYTGINSKLPLDSQLGKSVSLKKIICVDNSGNPVDCITDFQYGMFYQG